ncbi:hypothetical protein R7X40_02685 [Mesomycoplasma ovipneumoniae]|nr:hypothetical protein [Mesomycoplasma ovipneumoniae]MDW2922979.1 hypothetical protein [Mesomycoplasma ovipneumoniae]
MRKIRKLQMQKRREARRLKTSKVAKKLNAKLQLLVEKSLQ